LRSHCFGRGDVDEIASRFAGHDLENVFGEIAMLSLDFFKDRNEAAALVLVFLNNGEDTVMIHTIIAKRSE